MTMDRGGERGGKEDSVGWSSQQLNEFVTVVSTTINKEKSNAVTIALKEVLKNKSK